MQAWELDGIQETIGEKSQFHQQCSFRDGWCNFRFANNYPKPAVELPLSGA
jgi:hypothetical protein